MRTRAIVLVLLPLLVTAASAKAQVEVLPGPGLSSRVLGWSSPGLQIRALEDVVLERFVFNNQGHADTIVLLDSQGEVAGEYDFPGGENAHRVEAGWAMRAGETYVLVSADRNNGTWALFNGFPVANGHIQVDGVVGNGAFYDFIWFNFNQIETAEAASTVPVAVDVRPGSAVNPLNLKSRGRFPVAVLSDGALDATSLVLDSIRLAGAGVSARSNGRYLAKRADVNGDGLPDLLALFSTAELVPELIVDGWVTLTGVTADGTSVEGGDSVRLVPRGRGRSGR